MEYVQANVVTLTKEVVIVAEMLLRPSNGRSEDVSLFHCAHVPRVASVRYRLGACAAALRQASTRPAGVDRRGGGDGVGGWDCLATEPCLSRGLRMARCWWWCCSRCVVNAVEHGERDVWATSRDSASSCGEAH